MRNLLLLALLASPVFGQIYYSGNLDSVTCAGIVGWASSSSGSALVDIYDGTTDVQPNVVANLSYEGSNNGFNVAPPAALLDGKLHQIYVKISGTQINLGNTPLAMQCSVKSQGYVYYYSSSFGDPGSWNSYGSVSISSNIFTSNDPSGNPGSWISNVATPDGSSNYEVRTILSLNQSGGTYITWLRTTGNPMSGGSGVAVELDDPQFSGGGCTATLSINDVVNGNFTNNGAWTVPCANGMEMRSIVIPTGNVMVVIGGQETWSYTTLTSGQPGVGAIDTPSGNGLTLAALGPHDSEAPSNVNPASVQTYLTPNEVDLQWTGAVDNPSDGNGVGLWVYFVFRDGVQLWSGNSSDFTDPTVNPGESHTYQIFAQDWHGNSSPTWASVSITVPAAGSVDPRRVGVTSTGNYWGGMGEQIDVLSGNVNYSIAMFKAMGRGGWSVPFGLSYNSQNWRQEGSTSWVMGADVGYGFGWQFMAGSIRPYWNGIWGLDHFVYTDATGAQYRLDQQNGNVWSSKQSIYVWFDYSTSLLHFKDGSSWFMGCVSSGEEQDAGAMYPTQMEDSNGNYISISYLPGAGPYASNGAGTNPPNSSARISQVADSRSAGERIYNFSYNSDQINHLTSITNTIGTGENYSFTVSGSQALNSPFTNTSACGSTNANCGYAVFLSSVTRTGPNMTTSFGYDSNGYGDLEQVTFPYGGHIRWAYRNFTYASGRSLQEVDARSLLKDVTASETTYSIGHNDAVDPTLPIHSSTLIIDPSGAPNNPGKGWSFNYNPSTAWLIGTTTVIEQRNQYYAAPGQNYQIPAWALDAGGNLYIQQMNTYLDTGTANQRESSVITTLDSHGYGNVISSQVYDYAANGSSPPLLRTTTYTYLNDSHSAYDAAYIRNRVVATTVTPASGSGTTVTTNTYDNYPAAMAVDAPGMVQHDGAYSSGYTLRGNVTQVATPTGTTTSGYDIQGNAISTQDPLGNFSNVTVDVYGNVPQTATPNGNSNLSTSFSFNSFLAPTSVSQPSNGTSASATYDLYGRTLTTTSPDGAVTHYYYCPDSCSPGFSLPAMRDGQNNSTITVTNTHWSRNQYDGLGRVIRTDRGDTSGNVISNTDTNYDSCACSPTGKMVQTSQPYAPGAAVYWTTYTYDGQGRTLQVNAPDGASNTNYAYYGATTVVSDPAGNWKALTKDVDGNLKSVIEPDPTYSPSPITSAQSIDCVSTQAPSGMLGTCYAYDMLKNLTTVTMPRSTGTQTRTFTYQAGTNWLLTATNPENGTVTYTRDALGHVLTRVDAMGQTTTYTYDPNYRLTQVARGGDSCQGESYYYDTSIDPYFDSGASYGKLTAVAFGYGTPGSGACPGSGSNGSTWHGMLYEYQYSSAGRTTGKRMEVTRNPYTGGPTTVDLDAFWTYDNEGRMLTVQYPVVTDPNTGDPTSAGFTYAYDNIGRPITMAAGINSGGADAVSGVQYNASDQMLSVNYGLNGYGGNSLSYVGESRSYNAMNQVTSISATGYDFGALSWSEQYVYPSGQNNGQVSSVVEGSGESVSYQYDKLKRLVEATSTYGWSQTYGYDGFGNMTSKSGSFSALVDPSTNRLSGIGSYDANGNLYLGSWSYDVENRLMSTDGTNSDAERYMYDPSNKRVYKQPGGGSETYYFYGVDGKVLGEYVVDWSSSLWLDLVAESAYFGGKKVMPSMPRDRLGSVRAFGSNANRPYGENYTGNNADGFATYYQDSSTGLNYADQRYYNATFGRFISFDNGPGSLDSPQSWNRYAYAGNDPANRNDPDGLCPKGMVPVSNGDTATRNQIVSTAQSYEGQGLTHASGGHFQVSSNGTLKAIDCSGLVMQALAGISYSSPFQSSVGTIPNITSGSVEKNYSVDPTFHVGDIVTFANPGSANAFHMGIVTSVSATGGLLSFAGSQNSTGPAQVQMGTPGSAWLSKLSITAYTPCVPAPSSQASNDPSSGSGPGDWLGTSTSAFLSWIESIPAGGGGGGGDEEVTSTISFDMDN